MVWGIIFIMISFGKNYFTKNKFVKALKHLYKKEYPEIDDLKEINNKMLSINKEINEIIGEEKFDEFKHEMLKEEYEKIKKDELSYLIKLVGDEDYLKYKEG